MVFNNNLFRLLFWLDLGSPSGVPAKLAQANMDGSSPTLLIPLLSSPGSSLTIDTSSRMVYYSSGTPPGISSFNLKTKMSSVLVASHLSSPRSLTFHESRLYFLDPIYERISRVDLPSGEVKVMKENEQDLVSMVVWRKQPGTSACRESSCEQICIPSKDRGRVCGVSFNIFIRV